MESTGTYGDALRARLTAAGLNVQRVGGKAAHDYAEVFDGVPSQHDGKDAAVIAELAAFGKSRPWPYRPPSELEEEPQGAQQRQVSRPGEDHQARAFASAAMAVLRRHADRATSSRARLV